jgi:beta-galactosidase
MSFSLRFMMALGISASCAVACGAEGDGADDLAESSIKATSLTFPKDFRFGTAVAGFQVDMGCPTLPASTCEDRNSDWFQWVSTPRIVNNPALHMSKHAISRSPGFFETYKTDLDRAKNELHNDSLRLSIEWSRIFPNPTFGIQGMAALRRAASPEGVAFYHDVFSAMKARGLRPFVTVNHYSLPLWIHDGDDCNRNFRTCTARGWAEPATIVPEIAKYASFVADEYGSEVDDWATLNEPFSAVVLPGYIIPSPTRTNPPGLYMQAEAAKAASLAMIVAHARMYDAIKTHDKTDADGDGNPAKVGIVYNVTAVEPMTGNSRDALVAQHARYFLNDMFLQGVAKGIVDADWDGKTFYRADLDNRLDFIGVNYYATIHAQANVVPIPGLDRISPFLDFNLLNLKMNMTRSRGIYDVLKDTKKYGKPIIVAETGVDQSADRDLGARWIVETLGWTKKAMSEGVPVRGYFAWSLMDNYEWNHGMKMRFGLYEVVDTDKLKPRKARPVVSAYGRIAELRRIPDDLARIYDLP